MVRPSVAREHARPAAAATAAAVAFQTPPKWKARAQVQQPDMAYIPRLNDTERFHQSYNEQALNSSLFKY